MPVQVSYPGVYIDEFTPGAPIEGVGTATAAFLGPATDGPLNEPTKLTSWDAFRSAFGEFPLDGFYLWYAVRGFFENGGRVCFVTRVSNAVVAQLVLTDRLAAGGQPTIRVWARKAGVPKAGDPAVPTPIKVVVEDAHAVSAANAKLFRPSAGVVNAAGNVIKVANAADAAKFLAGDFITIEDVGKQDTTVVTRVEGDTIRFAANLTNNYNAGTVRLTSLKAGDKVFRVENTDRLASGSVMKISQDPGGGAPVVTDTRVARSVDAQRISPALTTYRVELRDGLTKAFDLKPAANDATVESQEFKLTVKQGATSIPYDEVAMDAAHPRYFATIINSDPTGLVYARGVEPPNTTPVPDNRPANIAAPGTDLAGGADDDPQKLTSSEYKRALTLLEPIDDVNMLAIPDRSIDTDVQMAMIGHCERMRDRFAILDSRRGAPPFGTGSVEAQRPSLESPRGYAAFYYPWLQVSPARNGTPILVPPSGHVAGIYSRIDGSRGVHKAPAGIEGLVNGALGVERNMSDTDQGQLNLQGINVIRVFQTGGRPTVWGARTTAKDDKNWQYVNIRRLFLFLEESIQKGIRWAVFEPHNQSLWEKLKLTIRAFLHQQWRDGALFGPTAEKAFYVRIDEALNPESQRALGRLYIEIGIRPAYPAEFIIVRIGIWQGGSEVTEG